jgi:hypothetical protein
VSQRCNTGNSLYLRGEAAQRGGMSPEVMNGAYYELKIIILPTV